MNQTQRQHLITDFFNRWGRLLAGGVPMAKCLKTISAETTVSIDLRKLSDAVRYFIEFGHSPYETLELLKIFPGEIVAAVQAGENKGNLDRVLMDLARSIETGDIQIGDINTIYSIHEKSSEQDLIAPVVKKVHQMFIQAIKAGASDIHIDPDFEGSRVRFRIDGVLQLQQTELTLQQHRLAVSHIKTHGGSGCCGTQTAPGRTNPDSKNRESEPG